MEKSNILSELDIVFRETLENKNINLGYETTANDVEDWDSLNHIQLVDAIERHFKIRFTSREIQNWKNVDEIISSIQTRI